MYGLPYSSHTSHHPSHTPCLPYATQKLMLDSSVSEAFFPCLKQNFIAYRSSKVSSRPDCIFEIHQLWQSGFSRVYSNCCCSCSFEADIIKINQSSHKTFSNNILNLQESTTILNACTKTIWKPIECTTYVWMLIINFIVHFFIVHFSSLPLFLVIRAPNHSTSKHVCYYTH